MATRRKQVRKNKTKKRTRVGGAKVRAGAVRARAAENKPFIFDAAKNHPASIILPRK
jgi:hypothetical protein